ncbi:YbaB/EbfC family nucleoid-associated protein [Actinoplanes sp. NPDC026619]|uniref:YbaB/EbfC family nucleoid-associated protein n=1 Tax=Actinoplanes sp. NPDC026619 TaxID=3155798 RepID=UPI0033FB3A75
MTEGLLDPDGAMGYLRDWKSRVDRMAADTQAMSDRLTSMRVTATDDNKLATVTIDSTGVLVDVEFAERIQRVAPDAVSRAVLSALRSARLSAARLSRQIVAETIGDDSVAGRAIAERMEKQLAGGDRG